MLRDVFYYGKKPNIHPRERFASSIDDAREKSTTEHFWIINEFCDYKNFDWDFDFDFLPDDEVWTQNHNNIWPSMHQKDSGTWLCSKEPSTVLVYRSDVGALKRNIQTGNWVFLDKIDKNKFDLSWHPDPTDPPYIYKWGCKYYPVEIKSVLEYHVPGASQIKYMNQIVELEPLWENWIENQEVDKDKFDMSWRPDPMDPPFIYVWGNKWQSGKESSTLEYHTLGATEKKYMPEEIPVTVQSNRWKINTEINTLKFDLTWRPDPKEPPYIYVWGNKYEPAEIKPTIEYHCPEATEKKYMGNDVIVLPQKDRWKIYTEIDETKFDLAWRPDPKEPPYIYVWGNKYEPAEIKPTLEYYTPGATEKKYMGNDVIVLPQKDRWKILEEINDESFDFTWRPDPLEPPYIYVFGNDLFDSIKMATIEYHCIGATERKYMDYPVAKLSSNKKLFEHLEDSVLIDYAWLPDPDSPPYIYAWGNQWNKPQDKISVQFVVEGATEYKYMEERATRKPCMDNWITPDYIDMDSFDYSWEPSPADPPYIYEFGTQWQKTGGPCYVVPGATERKYVDIIKAKALPSSNNWTIPDNVDVTGFDFSWHPDNTSPPYIYHFATQWALTGGPIYTCYNATETKYLEEPSAIALPDRTNWVVPADVDAESFDFSWHPYIEDQPYIYVFGTQWQKTGGPKYVTPGVTPGSPTKYIDRRILQSSRLPNRSKFAILNNYKIKDFDWSWHPDDTDEPYIYIFGNSQYPAEIMPTIEYAVPGAKQIKYVNDIIATLDQDMSSWEVPADIDTTGFDFSWKPNPKDPPFIYEFGTQWQKTGGPRYVVGDATEVKYVTTQQVQALATASNWIIPENIDVTDFDFSWHPDNTSPSYIYVFPTQWAISGGPRYIIDGATEIKYVDEPVAKALPDKTNWEIPEFVDPDFDYSWHPYSEDEPFIYQFGTQWQKTGGHRYITPGVHKNSAIKYVDTRIIKSKRLPNMKRFAILGNVKIKNFDYSWHPDDTEEPYIYIFGNNQYPAEEMPTIEYNMPGAKQIKYVHDVVATLDVDMSNWEIPENVDITGFDFSWKPNPKDPPYIYEFGTQWQKSGGPRYVVGDATDIKYVTTQQVKKLLSKNNWVIPEGLSIDEFDFSWHPDATDIPYIYQFGTQWAITGGPRYVVEGAKEVKYIDNPVAISKGDKSRWIIPDDIDQDSFDFSWHPYVEDQPYIYQFGTQWQKTGGPKYIAEGADETSFTKYIDRRILQAKKLPVKNNLWHIPHNVDSASIDYSWHPDETEEPYIYHFGTQWNNRGGPEYRIPGATKYKYSTDIVAKTLPIRNNWNILIPIDESSFDFSWVPHPDDPPYIYVFGNQWNRAELEPTVQYVVPGAKKIKYIHDIKAKVLPNMTGWANIEDVELFDYSWRPDPTEPAYIYVFGNKQYSGNIMPTVRFTKPGATQIKYIDTIVATLKQKPELFENTRLVSSFDYSWRLNPKDPPYIYQFGTQWQKTGGPRYVVKGATEIKYIEENKAIILPDMTNWVIPEGVNVDKFDFSWHPDDTSPKYIYQFGTIIDPNDGPRYIVPGNDGHVVNMERVETENSINVDFPRYYIKTTLEDLINEHPSETFWALNTDIDYLNFDFSWRPSIDQANYIHVFGSPDSELTQTYFVNASLYFKGNTQLRFVEDAKLNEEYLTKLFKKPDMFFVDRGNKEVDSRFEQLKIKFPDIQKTRYLNSWVDTINRCTNRATSKLCWILNSELDYTNFNFDYYPNPWQMKMVHVFGTQWSHWGTTFMINRETFREDTKYIKIIEHLSNLNFVKNKIAVAINRLYDVYIIDHGNKFDDSLISHLNLTKVPYQNSYFETFKNIVSKLPEKKDHYIWICSSVCDYNDFDFTYICDPFAREQLHVFPSDKQKMGDTFLVNVNKLRELLDKMEKLEDYEKINYNSHLRAKRLPEPRIITLEDTHSSIADIDFDFPYATFVTEDNQDQESSPVEPMSLWSEEHKKIIVTSTGGTQLVVPKEIRNHVKNELYDYPYIVTNNKLSTSTPLDIVFLSNGEKYADENYEYLLRTIEGTKNRVVRVDGVNGRVKAYHAALEASNTPWAFTVFAKLKVNSKFDWNWQPDRLQKSKHYIFTAKNPLNGLIYGHQAVIAYNKKLVLANQGKGLDFTLDDLHESVNMLSGTAMFNTDEFSTWRTAFREVIKLKSDYADISQERLEVWLTKADGDFAQYCLDGARHAVEYYDEVEGDIEKLRLSYDWPWLHERFMRIYNK